MADRDYTFPPIGLGPFRDEHGWYFLTEFGERKPWSWPDGPEFSAGGHRIGHHRTCEAKPECRPLCGIERTLDEQFLKENRIKA